MFKKMWPKMLLEELFRCQIELQVRVGYREEVSEDEHHDGRPAADAKVRQESQRRRRRQRRRGGGGAWYLYEN